MSAPTLNRPVPAYSAAEATTLMKRIEPQIVDLLPRYPESRAALLPVLHLVQKELNWIPPAVQRLIAFRLGIAPAEVTRVVGFYSLFRERPCGRTIFMVCSTLSCELNGSNEILAAVKEELGIGEDGLSADGRFGVEKVECLGWCDRAPVLQIDDSDYHDALTPEKARLIARQVRDGR